MSSTKSSSRCLGTLALTEKIFVLSLICIAVRKGVRQGCILSPLLLYSEEIFEKALAELSESIKINEQAINNIRYADDAVIIANNNEELQNIMQNIYIASEEYGLSLNISKTEHIFISKSHHPPVRLTINGQDKTLVTQGKVDSKRGPWRRRYSWLHNLRQWFGLSSVHLF